MADSVRPKAHTETTGGGGSEPTAANTDHWDDLVPYTEMYRAMWTSNVAGQSYSNALLHTSLENSVHRAQI